MLPSVLATPLTSTLKRFAEEEAVAEVITLVVLVATPFTAVVKVLPATTAELRPMTGAVPATPFTVVVKVLPVSEVVRELMTEVNKLETPLTTLAKVLVVVERALVVMRVVVARMPFTVEERTFDATVSVLVLTASGIEVVDTTPFRVVVNIPVEVA